MKKVFFSCLLFFLLFPNPGFSQASASKQVKTSQGEIPGFEDYYGVWIRKDLIQNVRNGCSLQECREMMEGQPYSGFLSLAIEVNERWRDSLQVCYASFMTQMPRVASLRMKEGRADKGFVFRDTYRIYKSAPMYLFKVGEELKLHVDDPSGVKVFHFQKVNPYKDFICSNQVANAYFHFLAGKYELWDAEGNLLQEEVYFDGQGNTNALFFKKFNVFLGYHSSIHGGSRGSITKTQKDSLRKLGGLDTEDILHLHRGRERNFMTSYSFALEKSNRGFRVYALKDRSRKKWALLFKRQLAFELIRVK